MNKRLLTIASMIRSEIGVIDVGTDHGYLPLYLAQNAYPGNIIASDINSSPLQTAVNSAREAGMEERISFLLSDGLEACDSSAVDTIVIAGMGGDTICGILDRTPWCFDGKYQFLFQPVTKPEILRYWLGWNGFEITEERAVEDGGIIYQIIAARFGCGTKHTDAELYIGKYDLLCDEPLFIPQLDKLIKRFEKAIYGLSKSINRDDVYRVQLFREILFQLQEMKKRKMGC